MTTAIKPQDEECRAIWKKYLGQLGWKSFNRETARRRALRQGFNSTVWGEWGVFTLHHFNNRTYKGFFLLLSMLHKCEEATLEEYRTVLVYLALHMNASQKQFGFDGLLQRAGNAIFTWIFDDILVCPSLSVHKLYLVYEKVFNNSEDISILLLNYVTVMKFRSHDPVYAQAIHKILSLPWHITYDYTPHRRGYSFSRLPLAHEATGRLYNILDWNIGTANDFVNFKPDYFKTLLGGIKFTPARRSLLIDLYQRCISRPETSSNPNIALLAERFLKPWRPERHHLYFRDDRAAIQTLLIIARHSRSGTGAARAFSKLPNEILHEIYNYIVA